MDWTWHHKLKMAKLEGLTIIIIPTTTMITATITIIITKTGVLKTLFIWHGGLNAFYTSFYRKKTLIKSPNLRTLFQPIDSWNFLQKMHFLDILVLFKLDLGQISFNPVENAFATQQLAFLATSIAFYHIVTWACAEIKILSFFSFSVLFCCSDWPSTGLACG